LIHRLAGAAAAAALIVVGILLAGRPVSDEGLRPHATATALGFVVAARNTWDGSQLLTVAWHGGDGQLVHKQFEDFRASPAWQPGNAVTISFDPGHPATDAVLAEPAWTFAKDFRADAVFQSVVPFTLAGIVLALAVIWPAGPWLFGDGARRARRSLRAYLLAPAVICGIVMAGAVVIQDQPLSADSLGADQIVGWLSVVLMLLLIWPYVRAVQYYRLRHLLTVPDDAADNAALIASAAGRRLQLGDVRMVALAGQGASTFHAGHTVRLYGRWERRGPALITDREKLLIGFAKRLASVPEDSAAPVATAFQPDMPADIISEPLIRQYPQLTRKMRLLLVRPAIVLAIGTIGSIAIVVNAGTNALAPLPTAWIFILPLIVVPIRRYRRLSRLLHMPHVARNGVVTSVTSSWRAARVPIVAMSADRTVRLRLIGERQVSWLAEGQEVVLWQPPTPSADSVVLAAEGGHAALAIATAVPAEDPTAVASRS